MYLVIAVDGPAASGKGSIASRLAANYGLPHLDTGLLYRATGLKVLADGADLGDAGAAARAAESVTPADLIDETTLTSRGAGEAASRVASHPGVRAALLKLQQDFARQAGGAVLDGRDIGTVIAPDAPVKLFVQKSGEIVAGGGEGVGHEVDVVSEKGFGARTESTRRLNGDVRQ